jgi:hypothetical protein
MENFIHMGKMGYPCFTIDENIIKGNYDKMTDKRTKDIIHETWKMEGELHMPKVMPKN